MNRRELMRFAGLGVFGLWAETITAGCSKPGELSGQRRGAATKPLDDQGRPVLTNQDRCALCAMTVADQPEWVGAVEVRSGATFYFCSVRCTFRGVLRAREILGVEASEIKRTQVPEYLAKSRWIEAGGAWFVVDSSVVGPMGLEVVPAATQADADTIVRRHGGRTVRRQDVTIDVLQNLKSREGETR